jgi:MFS family permease
MWRLSALGSLGWPPFPRDLTAEEFSALPRHRLMRGLWVTVVAGALGATFFQLTLGTIFIGFALALGAKNIQIGFLTAAMPLGSAAQLLAGSFIQSTGYRRQLFTLSYLASRSLWALVIVLPFLPEPWYQYRIHLLFALLVVSYILHAFGTNAWMSWMGDVIPADIRGRFLGTRQAITTAMASASGLIAARFIDWWKAGVAPGSPAFFEGFALLFGMATVFGLTDILLFHFVPHPRVRRQDQRVAVGTMLLTPLGDRNFRRFILTFCWWSIATGIAIPFFSVYLLKDLGLQYTTITIFEVASGVVTIAMSYLWGRAVHLAGPKAILVAAFLLAGLAPFFYLFTSPQVVWPVLGAYMVGSMGWSAVFVLSMNLSIALSPQQHRPHYLAVFAAITGAVTSVSYVFGGWLAHQLAPLHLQLWGFGVGNLQLLFALSGLLRASCIIPALAVRDVEAPAEGYVLLRALQTRLPFRILLDGYRLLGFGNRVGQRPTGPAPENHGEQESNGPQAHERSETAGKDEDR